MVVRTTVFGFKRRPRHFFGNPRPRRDRRVSAPRGPSDPAARPTVESYDRSRAAGRNKATRAHRQVLELYKCLGYPSQSRSQEILILRRPLHRTAATFERLGCSNKCCARDTKCCGEWLCRPRLSGAVPKPRAVAPAGSESSGSGDVPPRSPSLAGLGSDSSVTPLQLGSEPERGLNLDPGQPPPGPSTWLQGLPAGSARSAAKARAPCHKQTASTSTASWVRTLTVEGLTRNPRKKSRVGGPDRVAVRRAAAAQRRVGEARHIAAETDHGEGWAPRGDSDEPGSGALCSTRRPPPPARPAPARADFSLPGAREGCVCVCVRARVCVRACACA